MSAYAANPTEHAKKRACKVIDVTLEAEMMERHDDTMCRLTQSTRDAMLRHSALEKNLPSKFEVCVMTERMETAKAELSVRMKRTMMERHDDTMRCFTQPAGGAMLTHSAVETNLPSKVLRYV